MKDDREERMRSALALVGFAWVLLGLVGLFTSLAVDTDGLSMGLGVLMIVLAGWFELR